jgi:nucleoid DNA-binding protein
MRKKDLAKEIKKKMFNSVNEEVIKNALEVLIEELSKDLIDDVPISVKNFGTLSPYLYHGHFAYNVQTGERYNMKPFRTVKFNSHESFTNLVKDRIDNFKKTKDSS